MSKLVYNTIISVVIPVFNGFKWVDGIISSINNNVNEILEVVLVNDGDLDDFQQLEAALKSSVRVRIISTSTLGRLGPGAARNIGISASSGEMIAFLDCDDIWLPNTLSQRKHLLEKHRGAPFVYCSWQYITEAGLPLNCYILPGRTSFEDLIVTNYLATPSILIYKSTIKNFKFEQRGHEDYLLWLEMLKSIEHPAVGVTSVGVLIRRVAGSVSSNKLAAMKWHWLVISRLKIFLPYRFVIFLAYLINAILKRSRLAKRPLFLWLGSVK